MASSDAVPVKQRLALFLPNLGGGGAERVALAMIQGFVNQGYAVDLVLVQRKGVLLPLVPDEVHIVDLGASKLRQALWPLVRYLRDRRPYALHAMMWPLPLIAIAARKLARTGTRIVGSEHTTLSAMPHALRYRAVRALTRRAYLGADGLVAVSAGVADDLSAFIGLPRERITVINNPLLLPDILPYPQIATAMWPEGTKRILAVGALKSEKNYPLLLHALSQVRELMPASLLILGDGPLREKLERQIVEMGLGDAVVLAGFTTDPWPYFAAADLFVLSSDTEGLPTVLIEALHADLPIVSTDCPNGPREILDHGAYGVLVPCGDEGALADALARELNEDRSRLGCRSRAQELSGSNPLWHHIAAMIG